jgi:phosphate:Na+ symporter
VTGVGQALAGFGLFFLGISILKGGFETLLPWLETLDLSEAGFFAPFAFLRSASRWRRWRNPLARPSRSS